MITVSMPQNEYIENIKEEKRLASIAARRSAQIGLVEAVVCAMDGEWNKVIIDDMVPSQVKELFNRIKEQQEIEKCKQK